MIKPKQGLKDITNNTDNSIQKRINNFKDLEYKEFKDRKKRDLNCVPSEIKLNKLLNASSHKALFTINFPEKYYISKVDERNKENPQTVYDYISSIYQEYLKQLQHNGTVNLAKGSSSIFANINSNRMIAINYIIHISFSFKLLDETLHIAIDIFDRYLKQCPIYFSSNSANILLTLSGCLFIASKYEEIYYPEPKDFVWITNKVFDEKSLITKENQILKEIKYDITRVSRLRILERLSYIKQFDFDLKVKEISKVRLFIEYSQFLQRNNLILLPIEGIKKFNKKQIYNLHLFDCNIMNKQEPNQSIEDEIFSYGNLICLYLSQFFMETCFLEEKYMFINPLLLASACFYIARKILYVSLLNKHDGIWDEELINHSTYKISDFYNLAKEICVCVDSYINYKSNAVYVKYSSVKYFEVCKINFK